MESRSIESNEKPAGGFNVGVHDETEKSEVDSAGSFRLEQTQRTLKSRHIQLIGIGGTIGTVLFVQIGAGLMKGGPASLFIAFGIWSTFILAWNNCLSEMVTWMPVSSPFVRFADRFLDPAVGFCAGINYFFLQAMLVPFEIVAFNVLIEFWTDKIPIAAVITMVLVAYCALNFFAVKHYGEAEFWLSIGKVFLITGLIAFTFVTMVGGNPLHDAYGFRYWNPSRVSGTPFAEYLYTGSTGRFLGFLACVMQASSTITGPDYVSMTAGEAEHPRYILPRAFRSVFYRLSIFFMLGSLCVGVVVPYNDSDLIHATSNPHAGTGASPYIIAMKRMGIPVLPHIVNALVMTSIFSAGNSYVYCASRTLYGLALEHKAPAIFAKCTKSGVPIYSVGMTIVVALLAFLQVSNNAAIVLRWILSFATSCHLINVATNSASYIRFYHALKLHDISRDSLPVKSPWQPFCAYYAMAGSITMLLISGYAVFLPGRWSLPDFLFPYTALVVLPILFLFYKIRYRTKWQKLESISFFKEERAVIDSYEESLKSSEPT